MPREVLHQETLKVTEPGVTVDITDRVVTIEGKYGKLVRDFKHLNLDFEWVADESTVVARCWFGNKKLIARVGTLFGHIKTMVRGVSHGYRYKMRFVTAHFPIKHSIQEDNTVFGFSHFMGQTERKIVVAPEGVKIKDSPAQKEEIWVEGPDLGDVALTCARIHERTKIKGKDLRSFLDGIYVSEKGLIDG